MQNRRNTTSELLNDPDDETIAQLAAKLNNTVYDKSAELAREVLKRPRTGTDEWRIEVEARNTPEGRLRTTQEYLTRLRILKAANVDLERTVLEARDKQITWEQIGEACRISRQGAYDRWGRAMKQKEQLREVLSEVAAQWEQPQLDVVEKFDPGGERNGTPRRRGRSSAPRSRR
jgi:hypothetical protein